MVRRASTIACTLALAFGPVLMLGCSSSNEAPNQNTGGSQNTGGGGHSGTGGSGGANTGGGGPGSGGTSAGTGGGGVGGAEGTGGAGDTGGSGGATVGSDAGVGPDAKTGVPMVLDCAGLNDVCDRCADYGACQAQIAKEDDPACIEYAKMCTGPGGSNIGYDAGAQKSCTDPGLTWKTAAHTYFTSDPVPGSDECIKYSGCKWSNLFAACGLANPRPDLWTASHNIVSVFPDFPTLRLHDLCLKNGSKTIVVTVFDECADTDCDGCCTQNKGGKDELIDVEQSTEKRVNSTVGSSFTWADLGPTKTGGCHDP
jgi:hypothetical protein